MSALKVKSFPFRKNRDRVLFLALCMTIAVFVFWTSVDLSKRNLSDYSEYVTVEIGTEIVTSETELFVSPAIFGGLVNDYNQNQQLRNFEEFGELKNDSIVIVVQVHKRITYLRHLIVSLAKAQNISDTLLIFSHDFYDENINEVIKSIDFCKVMQIFYPFSIQTHPNEFPGTDPKDCKRDMKKDQALTAQCLNANFPDHHGHYREASFTQTKHHWWWKANRVFDQLEVTKYHNGLVLFLEEDHYVAEDALHMLNAMRNSVPAQCPNCNMITLGKYDAELNNQVSDKVQALAWVSSKHNMGMAFNRSTWNEIKSCSGEFCSFDDYNWDWSLQHTGYKCMKNKLIVLAAQGPRVFHIGECGLHHKTSNCNAVNITKIQERLKNASGAMFPVNLTFNRAQSGKTFDPNPNGGWADPRDIALCMSMNLN